MSVRVNPTKTFPITLKYREVCNEEGDVVGIKLLHDSTGGDDVQECHCTAVGRDFDTMSSLLDSSSAINHITGTSTVQMSKFCRLVFLRFFRTWNEYEEDGLTPAPINSENMGRVHDKVVRALVRRWLLFTDGNAEG